uniref:PB1 domain-containing protein n=1 Tax=Strigamia maritima TaxID=126957 RepID=T1JAI0_STRMM
MGWPWNCIVYLSKTGQTRNYRHAFVSEGIRSGAIKVYHCESGGASKLSMGSFIKLWVDHSSKYPLNNMARISSVRFNGSYFANSIFSLWDYYTFLCPMDYLLQVTGSKPILRRIFRLFSLNLKTSQFGLTREWQFNNENTMQLWNSLTIEEKKIYNFDLKQIDWSRHVENYVYGLKVYQLQEHVSTISSARKRFKKLVLVSWAIAMDRSFNEHLQMDHTLDFSFKNEWNIFEKMSITRSRDNIRIKTAFSGQLMVTYIHSNGSIDALCSEMREICRFDDSQEFTMKWVDEDGDPCTISSQQELDEAIRLYRLNKHSELKVHVFPCVPSKPGMSCVGEDRNCTKEEVQLTPDDSDVIERIDQSEFEGFEYVNPLLMSLEDYHNFSMMSLGFHTQKIARFRFRTQHKHRKT